MRKFKLSSSCLLPVFGRLFRERKLNEGSKNRNCSGIIKGRLIFKLLAFFRFPFYFIHSSIPSFLLTYPILTRGESFKKINCLSY